MHRKESQAERTASPQSGKRETAQWFFQRGAELQQANELKDAILCYRKSIELYPTAETHTVLGWIYSVLGRYDEAIVECVNAIQVDPELGNPYNDIGTYLIELGRSEEAIPWLERATAAKRYDARCFPHLNLGLVYEQLGKWREALAQYEQALSLNPDSRIALRALNRLTAQSN